ncbi:AlpA family phage regulatory protein [Escherichia coli]|nr:AlpA family phage regulatory protein [Escherichia coli]
MSLPPGTVIFDRLVYERECKALTGLCRMTRWRMEKAGTFPTPRKPDGTRNAWMLSELIAWMRIRPQAEHRPGVSDDEGGAPCPHVTPPPASLALLERAAKAFRKYDIDM